MTKAFTHSIGVWCSLIILLVLPATNLNAQYCAFSGSIPTEDHITNVTFAGINNTSGPTGYSNFTSISGIVSPGLAYPISGKMGNDGDWEETLTVYIDWDQSQTFDADERYDIGSCADGGCANPGISGTITVPPDAAQGETRMRVIGQYFSPPVGPCTSDGAMTFGEVEDYSITVLEGECTPPNFTFTIINDCEAGNYDVSALLSDFGTNTFITVSFTRSDAVPINPVTLVLGLQGETVNILNNIPFGVTVTAVIEGQNPLCNLNRTFAQLICPAENDEACTAIELSCGDVLANQPFVGATQSFNDACFGPATADVWYKFTSDGLEKYIIAQTLADVVVDLWSGDDCGTIEQVAGCQDFPESFEVTEAGTYYFRIRPYFTGINFHNVSLTCVPFQCEEALADIGSPCNDGNPDTYVDVYQSDCSCAGFIPVPGQICEVPLEISSLPYTTLGNTADYYNDYEGINIPPLAPDVIESGNNPNYYLMGDDVVYSYTPSNTQSLNITVSNIDSYAGIFVFTGCPFASTVAYSNTGFNPLPFSINGLEAQAGVTYYIVISRWALGQATSYTLNIQSVAFDCPLIQANFGSSCDDGNATTVNDVINENCECAGISIPDNDLACNASVLVCGDTLANQSFAGATASMIDDCFNSTNGDLWYSVTLEEGFYNHVRFQGIGSLSTSVTIEIFVADDCNDLSTIFIPCTPSVTSLYLDSAATYLIRVRASDNAEAVTMILNCYEEAENGECNLATELACGETYYGNTIAAPEYDENLQFCGTSGSVPAIFNRGVWFTYTPDSDVQMTFDLSGSTFDTEIFLYSNTCDDLVCVNGDDEGGEGTTSLLTDTLYAGMTYYIFVTGWNNSRGEYTLNTSCIDLACSPSISSLEAVNAQGDPLPCVTFGDTYYLEVTLSGGGQPSYNVSAGGSPSVVINVNSSGIVGPITGGNATVTVTGTLNSNCGANELYIPTICAPANDDACGATLLTCAASVVQSFQGATPSLLDACNTPTNPDVWFKFVADGAQTYRISLGETPYFNAVVQLFVGDDCDNLTAVSGCQDSPQFFNITFAGTYYARARAWSSFSNTQPITVSLACTPFDCPGVGNYGEVCNDGNPATVNDVINGNCECIGAPVTSNDEACTATVLSCGDVLTGQSFAGATASFDDACFGTGTKDVWFKFTANGTQTYTVAETAGDMVVSLYTGNDCSNLTQVGVCQDEPEYFVVTQAGTYYFRIRPYSNATTYGVSLTCTPFDCPGVGNIDDACDDGDPLTINDVLQADCSCLGVPLQENDLPCDAISVECGSTVTGNTTSANNSGLGNPNCAFGSNLDLFYTIDAVPGTEYTVSVNGPDYDGILVIYSGECDGTLNELDCSDSGFSPGIAETIVFSVETAQSILIRTYNYSSIGSAFTLSVNCISENPVTLNGTVNWNSSCGDRAGTVKLYTPNTATLIEMYNITVGATGAFSIENLPTGTYDVIVKVQGYLAKGVQDVVISAGANTLAVGTLRNGNVNNDNFVNFFDVSLINAAFNKTSTQAGYNPLADLNCDGSINFFDISILNSSFNKAGATAPL